MHIPEPGRWLGVPPERGRLAVGVTTKNRPDSLRRCLASLALLHELDLLSELIVVDDASEIPIESAFADLPLAVSARLRVVRQGLGNIVGRNTIVRMARAPFVLLLDDDTQITSGDPIREALAILERSPDVGAIALAQASTDGSPWPPSAQPSTATHPCVVAAFIGFAHIVNRDVFLNVGGYRESFHFYGEEKEYCLRLLDKGYRVIYLPRALVVHAPDAAGRSASRYVRYVIRNDCLGALYNEPMPLPLLTVPLRLSRYFAMCRNGGVSDPGGFVWIVREILAALPTLGRERHPVTWSSLRRWRSLRRSPPPFEPRVAQ